MWTGAEYLSFRHFTCCELCCVKHQPIPCGQVEVSEPVDPATGLTMEQTYLHFGGGPDPQDDCCST